MDNPPPLLELQDRKGFKLRLARDMSEEMTGEAVPLTDSGFPFF